MDKSGLIVKWWRMMEQQRIEDWSVRYEDYKCFYLGTFESAPMVSLFRPFDPLYKTNWLTITNIWPSYKLRWVLPDSLIQDPSLNRLLHLFQLDTSSRNIDQGVSTPGMDMGMGNNGSFLTARRLYVSLLTRKQRLTTLVSIVESCHGKQFLGLMRVLLGFWQKWSI